MLELANIAACDGTRGMRTLDVLIGRVCMQDRCRIRCHIRWLLHSCCDELGYEQ